MCATRQETRRQRAPGHDPARPRASRLSRPHRPAALAARIKPSSETVTASARHVPHPNGTPAHPDTLSALGNPDGQQPDNTDA